MKTLDFTISISVWRDSGRPILKDHEQELRNETTERVSEAIREGYFCGEISASLTNKRMEEVDYTGWWSIN